jgi:hypothetical protein
MLEPTTTNASNLGDVEENEVQKAMNRDDSVVEDSIW